MRVSDLDGRRVGVWGAGREGRAALRSLATRAPGASVLVYTDQPLGEEERAEVSGVHSDPGAVEFAAGAEGLVALRACEAVIRSPGVSLYRPEVEELRRSGVELTTGTNLFFAERSGEPTVVITGTKGKSTTASLLAHLLRAKGARVELAGNIGAPLLSALDAPRPDHWVLELSSYQLADLRFAPAIGVVLNLYREHVDWHGTEARYRADKVRFLGLEPAPEAVLNAADPFLSRLADELGGRAHRFGEREGIHVEGGDILAGDRVLYAAPRMRAPGHHNLLNACAALTTLEVMGVGPGGLGEALESFAPLPHRLQVVATENRVRFVDDSIATTPEATIAALDAFAGEPIVLLVGGQDRGQDYDGFARAVLERPEIAAIVAMPDNGAAVIEAIRRAANGGETPELLTSGSLEEAVRMARAVIDRGVVLLSPAAPSYGRFKDFVERGVAFARAIGTQPPAGRS